jgi:hypothetical protein
MIRIAHVAVEYVTETPAGPKTAVASLAELRKHCQAERVDDLIDDLIMLIEDVGAARAPAGTVLSIIRGGGR